MGGSLVSTERSPAMDLLDRLEERCKYYESFKSADPRDLRRFATEVRSLIVDERKRREPGHDRHPGRRPRGPGASRTAAYSTRTFLKPRALSPRKLVTNCGMQINLLGNYHLIPVQMVIV